jgi:hypothetical protein
MILEKQKQANVLEEGQSSQDSIGMSLDLDSAQILMQMLSKNLYSDAIGSTIRECASNALDSHRRAGTTDPIIVSFKPNKQDNYEFSVEDFGTGLDADDVRNIISKYGKSTKRNSANELGMMGLGFKAPLAYSSSFYFVARKNGMERKYMMYEGEETNTIDLLYEAPTTERNGVKVIIPIAWRDKYNFISKIKEQLAYFESVYFDVPGLHIDNDFTIIRHDHFQWSPLCENNHMHICLDNVYYPLDFNKLGLDTIYLPVALRFNLTDGIFPTPNREALRYTEEAKQVILNKLTLAANYFIEKYNESVRDGEDALAIFNHYGQSDRDIQIFEKKTNVKSLEKYATIKFIDPKIKGLENLNVREMWSLKDYIFQEWKIKFHLYNKRFNNYGTRWNDLNIHRLNGDEPIYCYSDKISGITKDYMRSVHNGKSVYFVKKEKPIPLMGNSKIKSGIYDNYHNLLKLYDHPKNEWRKRIQDFQKFMEMLTSKFINLDEVVVPDSFIQSKKKNKSFVSATSATSPKARRVKLQGEVTGKQATTLERWVEGKNCKWVPTVIQMKDAHKLRHLVVYGKQEWTDQMDKYFNVFCGGVKFMIFSEREMNNLKDVKLHNWIKMEDFVKGEHKAFRRIVTAAVIKRFIDSHHYVFYRIKEMAKISNDLYDKIESLQKYVNANHKSGRDDTYSAMIEVADAHNLYDEPIYTTYKSVKAVFEKLPFIDAMFGSMSYNNQPIIDATIDLFKYYKQRIDWKHYNIKLNEDRLAPVEDVEEITA